MASRVVLKSRIPEIETEMKVTIPEALHLGAMAVADEAKNRVPVATGRLRDAIHVDSTDDGFAVVAGDSTAFYGHMVEHGTTTAPAHPFLIPSLEMMVPEIERLVAAALKNL